MHRKLLPLAAFSFIVVTALWLVVSTSGELAGASQVVPTPRGQLGGPEPLPTGSAPSSPPESTPTPAPDAAGCDVEPVSSEVLIAAANAAPASAPTSWDGGAPATPEQTTAAQAVILKLIDCANRNDPARVFALFTEEGIARSLARQGLTPQTVPLLLASSGEPLPDAVQARLVAVDRVLATDDGHLGAEFTLIERGGTGELRAQAYLIDLVSNGDDWLIDDIQAM
jgi:hypothetical protein